MQKKLTYTYRGRPIEQRGKPVRTSSWSNSRRKNSGLVFFIYSLCVLVLASVLVWIFFLVKQLNEKESDAAVAENKAETKTQPAVKQPEKLVKPTPVQPEKAKPVVPKTVTTPATVAPNELRVYNAGLRAFSENNYVNARNAMRLLLDKMAIQPGHPLYNKACQILGDSNMKLYYQGSDPAEWGEHVVRRGDMLSKIASKNSTTVKDLMEVNQLTTHNLRIGQKLRIPRSAWRIRLECNTKRLLLYSNGRLFKIYPLEIADRAKETQPGIYKVHRKQINPSWKQGNRTVRGGVTENPLGSRIMVLAGETGDAAGKRTALHGRTRTTERNEVWYSLTEPEIQELYKLIPSNTTVEITK